MGQDLTYTCPSCGEEAQVGKPCPGCPEPKKPKKRKASGAPQSWEPDSIYDGLDLPDEDFDYDEFVAREFGSVPHRKLRVKWYWWVLGIITLIVFSLKAFQLCWG